MKKLRQFGPDEIATVEQYLEDLPKLVEMKGFFDYVLALLNESEHTSEEIEIISKYTRYYIDYDYAIVSALNETLEALPESYRDIYYRRVEAYQRTMAVVGSPDVKEVDGKLVKKHLDILTISDWNPSYDGDYNSDKRQYICLQQAKPKEDFDKYYKTNLMYFKNVAMPFFYDFVKAMNFTIDSTELHSFAYHFGRAKWKEYFTFRFIGLGIVLFVGVMLYFTFKSN
jgi:hypothetical protein